MLFVVRFAGETDVRWRALNARTPDEARTQALRLASGEFVEYGAVDADTGEITILGTIGGAQRPTGT
jgi:hypothetical protein